MDSRTETDRVPPLNLTEEEAEYLWEMMMEEVGKEEVWENGDHEIVERLHSKVRKLVKGDSR